MENYTVCFIDNCVKEKKPTICVTPRMHLVLYYNHAKWHNKEISSLNCLFISLHQSMLDYLQHIFRNVKMIRKCKDFFHWKETLYNKFVMVVYCGVHFSDNVQNSFLVPYGDSPSYSSLRWNYLTLLSLVNVYLLQLPMWLFCTSGMCFFWCKNKVEVR